MSLYVLASVTNTIYFLNKIACNVLGAACELLLCV